MGENRGRFKPGEDRRRHVFSKAERRAGFLALCRLARSKLGTRGKRARYVLDCLLGSGFRSNRGWPGDEDGAPYRD